MNNKINQITILISQIQNAHNSELTVAQEWMLEHVKDPELKKKVPKLSVVAYHILDTLSQHQELTGIKIAQELGVTRGGITRAARKMQDEKLIVAVRHEDNKKNIYYQLTPEGQKIARLHAEMHQELYRQLQEKISTDFTSDELDSIIRFLSYIKDHVM